MLKGIFILRPDAYQKIYGPAELEEINQLVDIYAPLQTSEAVKQNPSILAEAEVILEAFLKILNNEN